MILSDEQHLFVHDREILAKDLANKSEEECYRILCGYKRGKEKYKKTFARPHSTKIKRRD